MQLRHYLRITGRRRRLIVLAVLVTAGSAYSFSSGRPPTYEARVRYLRRPPVDPPGDLGSALEELNFSREFIASYAEPLKSRPLAERVIAREGLPHSAET